MIDIHCHLLPGIDDGPGDMEETLEMALQASGDGITDIICTPHMHNGLYHIKKETILGATLELQELLNNSNIPLQVHPGAEVHIHSSMLKNLDNSELLTMCQSQKYLLLEFPAVNFPNYARNLVNELLLEGIVPVIAHPERNSFFNENPSTVADLIKLGAVTQINTGSLLGQMGKSIQKFTRELLNNRMVHLLASDGHNAISRRPLLSEAYAEISKIRSADEVKLLMENAEAILKGEGCKVPLPLYRKKHWICRWFL